MTETQVILVTLVTYKIVLVLLGLFGQRRTHDKVDFFLGGRRLGPIVAALSASASSSSAWTLIGVSGLAYAKGLSAFWVFPACVGGFMLNWYGLAPGLRRLGRSTDAITATDILAGPRGRRGHRAAVVCASLITLVCLGAYVSSQFEGAGKTFAATFKLGETESVLIGTGIIVVYTLLGGFWAVSLTDSLQGIMMALAAVILPIAAVMHVGGPGALWDGLMAVEDAGFRDWVLDAPVFGSIGFVVGYFGIGLGYPGQPHVVNRFMALEEGDRAMRTARRVAIGWAVVIYTGMLITGWAGRLIIPGLADREDTLIALTQTLFPPVFAGVFLAAVLSAIMSTADSQLLVAASAVSHDLAPSEGSNATLLWRSRAAVVLVSAGAAWAALSWNETIFSWVLFAWSAMGCAFGPLLLLGAWRGRVAPAPYAIAAMLAGFSLSVLAYLGPKIGALTGLDLPTKSGVFDRVLPFAVCFAIAWVGTSKRERA